MKSTVLVNSIGGLGNQMFCYAFYIKLKNEYPNVNIKMDLSSVYDSRYERNAEFLRVFPAITIDEASAKEIWKVERKITFTYRGSGSRLIRKIVDYCNNLLMKSKMDICITEEKYKQEMVADEKNILDEYGNLYFDGFWQQIEYYKNYIPQLKNDFIFAEIEDETNKEILRRITEQESISVHVRRGDYVGETLDILDTSYYTKIIKELQKNNPNSIFYFFTNDSEYVEQEYSWLKEKEIIKNNIGINSFRDMQLMSSCKHNIIANSTFSIWAALLNSNQDRKVYYPSHYYQGVEMQDINIDGFIKVSVS